MTGRCDLSIKRNEPNEFKRAFQSNSELLAPSVKRITEESEEALDILQEYYEAVHVVQRDKPGAIREVIEDAASGMWLAHLGTDVVGCVVLL